MPKPKPKKMGRPTLPKGEAKGHVLQVRLSADNLKRISAAAKASKQTLSDWIRSRLDVTTDSGRDKCA